LNRQQNALVASPICSASILYVPSPPAAATVSAIATYRTRIGVFEGAALTSRIHTGANASTSSFVTFMFTYLSHHSFVHHLMVSVSLLRTTNPI
jgi:hypothetical protein